MAAFRQPLVEEDVRAEVTGAVVGQVADPRAAADFAVRRSSGESGQNLLKKISGQWAHTNPTAAMAWAQQLSDTKARDAVVRSSTGGQTNRGHAWSVSRRGISRSGYRPLDSRAQVSRWKRELSPDEVARVREITADVAPLYYGEEEWTGDE